MAAGCDPNYKHADWSFYRFEPSTAAAVIFIVLFTVVTVVHIFQMARTKTWYMIAFCLGGVCMSTMDCCCPHPQLLVHTNIVNKGEVAGYIGRAINANEEAGCWTLGPYVMQSVLLLIAPALMAASIYMILSRVILLTEGEAYAVIKRQWLTKIFVMGDVISLLLQSAGTLLVLSLAGNQKALIVCAGGSMMAGASDTNNLMKIGEYIIIAGLFFQLAVFGVFIVVISLFHRRMNKVPTEKSQEPSIRWRRYLTTLYITSALIWVRSVFRVIEYLEGNDGYIMRTEAFIFVFDAALIWAATAWMTWFHPGEIGLLLRTEHPIANGFELLTFRHPFQKMNS